VSLTAPATSERPSAPVIGALMVVEPSDDCTVTGVLWMVTLAPPDVLTPTDVLAPDDPEVLTPADPLPDPDVPTLIVVPVLGPLGAGAGSGAGADGPGAGGTDIGPMLWARAMPGLTPTRAVARPNAMMRMS